MTTVVKDKCHLCGTEHKVQLYIQFDDPQVTSKPICHACMYGKIIKKPTYKEVVEVLMETVNQMAIRIPNEACDFRVLHDGGLSAVADGFDILCRMGCARRLPGDREYYQLLPEGLDKL